MVDSLPSPAPANVLDDVDNVAPTGCHGVEELTEAQMISCHDQPPTGSQRAAANGGSTSLIDGRPSESSDEAISSIPKDRQPRAIDSRTSAAEPYSRRSRGSSPMRQ